MSDSEILSIEDMMADFDIPELKNLKHSGGGWKEWKIKII